MKLTVNPKLSTIFAMAVLLLTSAAANGQSKKSKTGLKDLVWLSGTWDRTNSKPGRIGHERWLAPSSNEMLGYGVTMKGSDTLFIEKLRIIASDTGTYYVADVPENKRPVPFKLTGSTSTAFIFENKKHDFPKRIEYKREGEKLHVIVSGDGKSIDYFFVKK